jgi:hypothetical protein
MIEYLAVAAGPIIIIGIMLYINARRNVDDIKENWVRYRCSPMYMPFTSMFDEETSTFENFAFCTNTFAKEIFGRATDPVYRLFGMIIGVVQTILGQINHFVAYLAGISNFVLDFGNKTFGKIFNSVSSLNLLIGKIRDLFQRIAGSAYYAAFIVQTLIAFIVSIFSFSITLVKALVIMLFALSFILALFFPVVLAFVIPLGALVGISFCFHPDTIVKTQRGEMKIRYVQPGDMIGNSKITAKFDFLSNDLLYNYKGVLVSGDHIVLHEGKWMYVKDTGCSQEFQKMFMEPIICLNTSDNIIQIGDIKFRDYEEVPDELFDDDLGSPALPYETYVTLANGTQKMIVELELGTRLKEGTVTGLVEIDGHDIEWYSVNGVTMSGEQPVYVDGKFVLAKDVGTLRNIVYEHAYQIFIDNKDGIFEVNEKVKVRDYPDSHDPAKLEEIQKIVMDHLNA